MCDCAKVSMSGPGGEIIGILMVIFFFTKESEIKPFFPSPEAKGSLDLYGNQLWGSCPQMEGQCE